MGGLWTGLGAALPFASRVGHRMWLRPGCVCFCRCTLPLRLPLHLPLRPAAAPCRCALRLRLPLRWHTTCDSSDGKCTAHAPCSVTHCALTGRLEEARLGARHLYVSCLRPLAGAPLARGAGALRSAASCWPPALCWPPVLASFSPAGLRRWRPCAVTPPCSVVHF